MVNKQIQTELNEPQFKETKNQFNKSIDKPELKILKLEQLNSKENRNLVDLNNNDLIQIKRAKLNDDLKFYDFLNKDLETNGTGSSVLSSYLSNGSMPLSDETNENRFLNSCSTSNVTSISSNDLEAELADNVLLDEFENSIEINDLNIQASQPNSTQLFGHSTNLSFNDPFLSFNQFTNQTEINSSLNASADQSSKLNKQFINNKNELRVNQCLNQADLFRFNNNSPSDYIKLDQENHEQIKCDQLNILNSSSKMNTSSSSSLSSSLDEKRLNSSQKINEDLLFSFPNDDLCDVINFYPDTKLSNFNCSPSLDSINSGDSMFCSSVFDSPPNSNSSNNSSLNNDLDLPFILSSDSNDLSSNQANDQSSFLDAEFPFLMSEDSIFNSFLNSNLNDLINTDEFFNEKCQLNDDLQSFENNLSLNSFLNYSNNFSTSSLDNNHSNSFNANRLRKNCTLSKDSNLAKLLKEKLPIKLPSQSNQINLINSNSSGNSSNNQKLDQSNSKTANALKKEVQQSPATNKSSSVNVNNNFNNTVNTTNSTANQSKDADLKKNNLITRKFTIQGLNVDKGTNISTGCLARSIKIIDPINVQVTGGNSTNVKYLLNNITTTAGSQLNGTINQQLTATAANFNLSPTNCITVTNPLTSLNGFSSSPAITTSTSTTASNQLNNAAAATNRSSTNQQTTTLNTATIQPTTKSFIIKSVDGKFTNGILYTPLTRNGTNIAYTSNLTTAANLTNCTTNGLFINSRTKLVQKRPYSSMSVSISNNNQINKNLTQQTTKDFYSIDLVPKLNSTTANATATNDSETKKKIKSLDTSSPTEKPSYSSSKFLIA